MPGLVYFLVQGCASNRAYNKLCGISPARHEMRDKAVARVRKPLKHDLNTQSCEANCIVLVFMAKVAAVGRANHGSRQLPQHLVRGIHGRSAGFYVRYTSVEAQFVKRSFALKRHHRLIPAESFVDEINSVIKQGIAQGLQAELKFLPLYCQ